LAALLHGGKAREVADASSDRAELSTLRAQVEDLTRRVVAVAHHYDDTPDSAVAADLFASERSLVAARRQLDRAIAHLNG
jgi:hypothetical protein